MTAGQIIRELKQALAGVDDVKARHPEDGIVEDRYETYEQYDEALNVELEALAGAVEGIIEEAEG